MDERGLHGDAPHSAPWGIPVVVLPHAKGIRQDPRSKGTCLCSLGSLDLKSHSKKLLTSNLFCMMAGNQKYNLRGPPSALPARLLSMVQVVA